MNKTSTLLGNLLDALRTLTLTSRRLSAPRRVMRVACKVPTNGLCFAVSSPASRHHSVKTELASRVSQSRVPQSY